MLFARAHFVYVCVEIFVWIENLTVFPVKLLKSTFELSANENRRYISQFVLCSFGFQPVFVSIAAATESTEMNGRPNR